MLTDFICLLLTVFKWKFYWQPLKVSSFSELPIRIGKFAAIA